MSGNHLMEMGFFAYNNRKRMSVSSKTWCKKKLPDAKMY